MGAIKVRTAPRVKRRAGFLIAVGVLLGCVSTSIRRSDARSVFLCGTFCYFFTQKHGIERSWITAFDEKPALAWEQLKAHCRALNGTRDGFELQKSRSTWESPGDDFIAATRENSCVGVPGSAHGFPVQ